MADITLEQLRRFSDASLTMITADAPLFGVVTILNGQVLERGAQRKEKVGNTIGFPAYDRIVAEASRFWIQQDNGVRHRKTRDEMVGLLRENQRAAGAS